MELSTKFCRRPGFPKSRGSKLIWNLLHFGCRIDDQTKVDVRLYVRNKRKYPILRLTTSKNESGDASGWCVMHDCAYPVTIDEALAFADGSTLPYKYDAETDAFIAWTGKKTRGESRTARAFAIEKICKIAPTRRLSLQQLAILGESPIFDYLKTRR